MTSRPPLSAVATFPLDRADVLGCVDATNAADALFAEAFERSLAALDPRDRRGALAGVTGHVAESIVELVLAERGWTPVWHFEGPGRHGVDLLMAGPGLDRVFAIEVKGTLRPRRWPRLRRGELLQMDVAWLDKADNPGMQEWGLTSADLFGAIVLVNFHAPGYRAALTRDFRSWLPVERDAQLDELDWLGPATDDR